MNDIFRDLKTNNIKSIKPTGRFIFIKGFHKPEEHIGSIMVRVLQDISDKYIIYHKKLIEDNKNG